MRDTHNSFKWALHQTHHNNEILSDLHIVTMNICNNYKHIVDKVSVWLGHRLRFVDEATLLSADSLNELWISLAVDLFIVSEICDLRMVFVHDELRVAAVSNNSQTIVH